jgi:catechol O-methyltransferase
MLDAIDEFSAKRDFLISIGGHKSGVLSDLISKEKPKVVVELGGYLGYSAILFANAMRREQQSTEGLRVWSLEMNSEFASIAREVIALAGLSDIVTVVVGTAAESLKKLKDDGRLSKLDLLFIDHEEELYVADFKVCEELSLLKKGTIIVADNVVRPGAPEYRELVRSIPNLKSEGVRGLIQPGDFEV